MLRNLVVLVIILAALLFVIYQFFSFHLGISATRSVFEKDSDLLKDYLLQVRLDPWNLKEINLLSRNGDSDLEESLVSRTERGFIYSIYDEPIIAYAVKEYKSTGERIVAVRINKEVFTYSRRKEAVSVFFNEDKLGEIKVEDQIKFTGPNMEVLIPHLERTSLIPVSVNGRKIFSIHKEEDITTTSDRVVEILGEFNMEEARMFLIVLFFAILEDLL